jgi:hypothetical protein
MLSLPSSSWDLTTTIADVATTITVDVPSGQTIGSEQGDSSIFSSSARPGSQDAISGVISSSASSDWPLTTTIADVAKTITVDVPSGQTIGSEQGDSSIFSSSVRPGSQDAISGVISSSASSDWPLTTTIADVATTITVDVPSGQTIGSEQGDSSIFSSSVRAGSEDAISGVISSSASSDWPLTTTIADVATTITVDVPSGQTIGSEQGDSSIFSSSARPGSQDAISGVISSSASSDWPLTTTIADVGTTLTMDVLSSHTADSSQDSSLIMGSSISDVASSASASSSSDGRTATDGITITSSICVVAQYETATKTVLTVAPEYDSLSSISGWYDTTSEIFFVETRCLQTSTVTSVSYNSDFLSSHDVSYITTDIPITFISTSTLRIVETVTDTLVISTPSDGKPLTVTDLKPSSGTYTFTSTDSFGSPSILTVTETGTTNSFTNQGFCGVTKELTTVDENGSSQVRTVSSTVICEVSSSPREQFTTTNVLTKTVTESNGHVYTITVTESCTPTTEVIADESGDVTTVTFTEIPATGNDIKQTGTSSTTGIVAITKNGDTPTVPSDVTLIAKTIADAHGSSTMTVITETLANRESSGGTTVVTRTVTDAQGSSTVLVITETTSTRTNIDTPLEQSSEAYFEVTKTTTDGNGSSTVVIVTETSSLSPSQPQASTHQVVTATDSNGSSYVFTVTESSTRSIPAGSNTVVNAIASTSEPVQSGAITAGAPVTGGSSTNGSIPQIETATGAASSLSLNKVKLVLTFIFIYIFTA